MFQRLEHYFQILEFLKTATKKYNKEYKENVVKNVIAFLVVASTLSYPNIETIIGLCRMRSPSIKKKSINATQHEKHTFFTQPMLKGMDLSISTKSE